MLSLLFLLIYLFYAAFPSFLLHPLLFRVRLYILGVSSVPVNNWRGFPGSLGVFPVHSVAASASLLLGSSPSSGRPAAAYTVAMACYVTTASLHAWEVVLALPPVVVVIVVGNYVVRASAVDSFKTFLY